MSASPPLRRYDNTVQLLLCELAHTWDSKVLLRREPVPGDLVLLKCAPKSEWHLSFYLEPIGNDLHLLESVQTGRTAKWGNVGFAVVNTAEWGISHRMRWTDEQFEFERKLHKAIKAEDAYIEIPFLSHFDGDHAQINVRTRWNFDGAVTVLPPFVVKKATIRAIREHIRAGMDQHKHAPTAPTPGASDA